MFSVTCELPMPTSGNFYPILYFHNVHKANLPFPRPTMWEMLLGKCCSYWFLKMKAS